MVPDFQYIDKGNKKGKIPSKMGGTVTCLPPLSLSVFFLSSFAITKEGETRSPDDQLDILISKVSWQCKALQYHRRVAETRRH